MLNRLIETSGCILGVLEQLPSVVDAGCGNAVRAQMLNRLAEVLLGCPAGKMLVQHFMRCVAAFGALKLGSFCPVGIAESSFQTFPLGIVGHSQSQPVFRLGAFIQVLRGGIRAAVAHSFQAGAVGAEFHHRFGCAVEGRLHHRGFHEHGIIGAVAFHQAQHEGHRPVHSCYRVARASDDSGLVVFVAGEPCHARDLFHRLGETHPLSPRPAQAESRHTHIDDAPVEASQKVKAQPELLRHPRRKVLHHRIALGDQTAEQIVAFGGFQIQGDPQLVGVRRHEHVPPLPPFGLSEHCSGHPHSVRVGARLYVDDLSPQEGEKLRGRRASPPAGEVDNPETGEGETTF